MVTYGVPFVVSTVTASLKVSVTVMVLPVAYSLSVPGLEVMATDETVGVVAWAWATDGRMSAARAMRRRERSQVNG